ncbi:MAG: hypothetical protein ABSA33_04330 [Candidatus Micrarchaeaceae archaeon]
MKMVAAAIVVIVIIAIGAVVLVGSSGKKAAQHVTSVATSSIPSKSAGASSSASSVPTTAPTTTVKASSSNSSNMSLDTLVGENLTVGQFARDVKSVIYASTPSQSNITYDYKTSIVSTGSYSFSFNSTGQINTATYLKNLRITTTTNGSSGSHTTTVYIYNATSKTYYICDSSAGSSYSCYASEYNVSQSNVSNLGYFSSLNNSTSGYISNVQISSSSYNGQSCKQISATVHFVNTVDGMATTTDGMLSMCFSQQNDALLTQTIKANVKSTSGSNTYDSTLNYSDNEVSMSDSSSASITNLPGPLSG